MDESSIMDPPSPKDPPEESSRPMVESPPPQEEEHPLQEPPGRRSQFRAKKEEHVISPIWLGFVFIVAVLAIAFSAVPTHRAHDIEAITDLIVEQMAIVQGKVGPHPVNPEHPTRPPEGLEADGAPAGSPRRRRYKPANIAEMFTSWKQKMPLKNVHAKFGRCALIGASKNLLGKKLGREIDEHDAVIRVNRLPSPSFYQDFGQRTDVYFAGMLSLRDCKGYEDIFHGPFDGARRCDFRSGERCRYETLIFKGQLLDPRQHPGRFPSEDPDCNLACDTHIPSRGPVCGEQEAWFHRAAHAFPALGWKTPTAGWHAFFTFAPICESLRLYGFGGEDNYDGHQANTDVHNYNAEHEALERFVTGTSTDWDWWPRDQQMRLRTEEQFRWWRWHIYEKAMLGNLSIAKN